MKVDPKKPKSNRGSARSWSSGHIFPTMRSPAGAFCLTLLLLASGSAAQQYDLRTFSLEQGLPSATVNALCEDRDGFLWIATDGGAARSEGLRFKTFGKQEGHPPRK